MFKAKCESSSRYTKNVCELDCPEVMGPCYLFSEAVAAAIKGLKIGKAIGAIIFFTI